MDANVPAINVGINLTCNTGNTDINNHTCSLPGSAYADFTDVTTVTLRASTKSSAETGGSVTQNISINDDNIVEPEEIIDVAYTLAGSVASYFENAQISADTISILSDDTVALTMTSDKTEGEGADVAELSWGDYQVEGYSVFVFDLQAALETSSMNKDDIAFNTNAGGGSPECTVASDGLSSQCSIALDGSKTNNLVANSAYKVLSFAADSIIEPVESLPLSASRVTNQVPLDITAADGRRYSINNDDFLSFSLRSDNTASAGSSSIMLEENNVGNLHLVACNNTGVAMEGGNLGLTVTPQIQTYVATPSSSLRLADADVSAGASKDIDFNSAINVVGDTGCSSHALANTVIDDSSVEGYEVFELKVTSSSDARCNNDECFSNATGEDHGLIVIADNDYGNLLSDGNDNCLDAAETEIACTGRSYPAMTFVKLNASGNPVLEGQHSCIADGSTGYVWSYIDLNNSGTISSASPEADLAISGSLITSASTVNAHDISAINLCGQSAWAVPAAADLLGVADFDANSDGSTPFGFDPSLIYLTHQACKVNNGSGMHSATDGKWAFSNTLNSLACQADPSIGRVRLVSY